MDSNTFWMIVGASKTIKKSWPFHFFFCVEMLQQIQATYGNVFKTYYFSYLITLKIQHFQEFWHYHTSNMWNLCLFFVVFVFSKSGWSKRLAYHRVFIIKKEFELVESWHIWKFENSKSKTLRSSKYGNMSNVLLIQTYSCKSIDFRDEYLFICWCLQIDGAFLLFLVTNVFAIVDSCYFLEI